METRCRIYNLHTQLIETKCLTHCYRKIHIYNSNQHSSLLRQFIHNNLGHQSVHEHVFPREFVFHYGHAKKQTFRSTIFNGHRLYGCGETHNQGI